VPSLTQVVAHELGLVCLGDAVPAGALGVGVPAPGLVDASSPQTPEFERLCGEDAPAYHGAIPAAPAMADRANRLNAGTYAAPRPGAMESTLDLLARAKGGHSDAVESLFQRVMPALRRWARGRLPPYARDLSDTQDLVQETVLHTLNRLESFEARHQGALQAYLRQAVVNRIRDEIRRVGVHPAPMELTERHPDRAPSPLEHAIGREGIERYETALARLRPAEREAIVARMELQQSYEEVAVALGKPNANAARVAVKRALVRLVEEMDRDES
jgi:RNA polymerase sigma-70 factor, ECF subfamily